VTVLFHGKRIRIHWRPQRIAQSHQNLALAASSLLTPCALLAFTLTGWSVAAEMHWTSRFFISQGFFSHWQSWLITSVVLLLVSRLLARSVQQTPSS
jgi:hypothetical protein